MRAVLLQRCQTRLDFCELGCRLRDFQVCGHAFIELQPGQFQAALGDVQVLLDHRQPLLGAAQLNVILGGLHNHQQLHGMAVFFSHLHRRICHLHRALHAPPQVGFPTDAEPAVPQVKRLLARFTRRVIQAALAVATAAVARRTVYRRQRVGGDLTAHGPALLKAAGGHLQVKVARLGFTYQRR